MKLPASEPNVSDKLGLGTFATLQRENLHEQIYRMLCDNLMMGRFEPGQKLTLRGLAKSLGTSLMPVRDALQRLESIGCLVSTARRTMMVPKLTKAENEGISHIRCLLEGDAARRAASRRTQAQIDALRHYCDEIAVAADNGDLDKFLTANFHFHMTIVEASGISFLQEMLVPLWMRLGPLVRAAKPDKAHISKAVHVHRQILKSLEAKDPDAAAQAVISDITECRIDVDTIPNEPEAPTLFHRRALSARLSRRAAA